MRNSQRPRHSRNIRLIGQYQAPQYQAPQYQEQEQYQDEPQYAEHAQADPSRYDDALYGQLDQSQDYQREPAYPDDPYAYQGYDEEPQEQPRKRGGMITVAAVLTLAVLGTGGAFAYRSFMGSPRSGEPPVIKADNSPTKIVPAGADSAPKVADRMTLGDGKKSWCRARKRLSTSMRGPVRAWSSRR